jgi:hypothetical protein
MEILAKKRSSVFLATTLNTNPGARALGFSLPVSKRGHKALLPRYPNMTHKFLRATYQQMREDLRLAVTQLAIGLEHVKIGGTMVVLFHKVEATDTVSLLYRFSKFSSVKFFKPTRHHTKRSSFYMIATNIQSQHCDVVLAVERWKRQWKVATFGTGVEYEEELRAACLNAEEVLGEFEIELVRLGREVWEIQLKALENAPFIKK